MLFQGNVKALVGFKAIALSKPAKGLKDFLAEMKESLYVFLLRSSLFAFTCHPPLPLQQRDATGIKPNSCNLTIYFKGTLGSCLPRVVL